MYNKADFKKGQQVVKIITGGGTETASIQEITKVKGDLLFLGDDFSPDAVGAYRISDGRAAANYITGFSSRIVYLEQ